MIGYLYEQSLQCDAIYDFFLEVFTQWYCQKFSIVKNPFHHYYVPHSCLNIEHFFCYKMKELLCFYHLKKYI